MLHSVVSSPAPPARRTPLPPWVPLAVVASAAVITASLIVTVLARVGVADVLPPSLRAVVGVLAVFAVPGLPIAALLRLPDGLFTAVAVSMSLATNILVAQFNYAGGFHRPYAAQYVVLTLGVLATAALARQWYRCPQPRPVAGVLRWARSGLAPTGDRRVSAILLLAVVVLFATAVYRLDVSAAGALGVVGIFGVDYWVGLVLLCVIFVLEYRRAAIDRLMIAVANVVLIAYITMPVAWSLGTAPFVTGYVHRMITNWLITAGTLPPPVDARISWAGFFSAAANLITTTGLYDSVILVVSASLIFGVLLMFPVYSIGLSITGSRRVAWLGVTMLTLFNWYQQDYFAPQAVAMQFYATILAVLLWQLRKSNIPVLVGGRCKRMTTAWRRLPGRVAGRDARWTLAVEATLVVILAAMVVEHQLTPLSAIGALVVFAVAGVTRYKLLWLAALVMFIFWFRYGATAYWTGHLGQVISDIGGVDQNLNSSVSQKITGDPTYRHMQLLRLVAALVVMAMAGFGWLRLRRMPGSRPWLIAALALGPFGLVLLQSYGGEVAIRAFLYGSPILSPLAALSILPLLRPRTGRTVARRVSAVAAGVVLLLTALLVTANRGLNISFERTTPHELAIGTELVAEIGDAGLGYWGQGALYGVPRKFELKTSCFESAEHLADCTAQPEVQYFSNTQQDENFVRYSAGVSRETMQRALQLLQSEKGYQKIYDSGGVLVLKRPEVHDIPLGGH
ncbi:hypothetical protein [Mycolicibacterium sp. P1-5]|uniref:hypothetical protein n=1 Tax=Mycolicibacterium sp. P1-5 TaxID=2024617 RepID=UPI0011ED4A73|nr:hypothetical protein [Mycolicibacterium sp. P1-5]KAA0104665.1 hypothetical protein CIW47_21025 [Mycolicibacterium sp. P1-5]